MTSSKVTLRDIAEKTGVTRMAVSLALRGKSGVSDATRRKVLKVAKELGYEPDPEVAKLMTRIRSRTPADAKACLALLTSGPEREAWKRSVTERKYVEGARARAREYGYRIEDFWINEPGMSTRRLGDIIWNRGIEGAIIPPLQARLSREHPRAVQLDYSLFSVVEISETVEWPDLDRAIHDQYTSTLKLLGELADLNYRRFGLVLEEALDLRVNGKWTAAYLQYVHRTGQKKAPPPLILPEADATSFDRWYDRHRPDVIISVNRFGLELVQARGLDIPGEVGYASLDLDGVVSKWPDASGIDQNSERVGAAAVDMLVAAIQRGQRGIPEHPVRTQIEGTWVKGASTERQRPRTE
jgi:LacI family transcriptional regulator